MKRLAKKILLIGWDAADWKFLTPLMDKGLMPNLTKLVEGGVKGRLATLDPPLSPTLWTSIATGKRPYKHGIHGFTELDPSGNGIRPIYSTARKVKAIWNIFTQSGLKSNIIGWWPSHPAEPIDGVMVSNFYQRAGVSYGKPWPMAKGTVHPESLSDTLAELRVHPGELTHAHIQPFVPDSWKIDSKKKNKLGAIAGVTADCSSLHCATTYLMENTEWDFTAIYLDAIDHYCHGFMKYHPPKQEHILKAEFDLYKDVVNGGCQYHDMMLGRLMELAGEDTTIILMSDHGFHPDHNRPKEIPKEPSGPAVEHSPFGIVVINGPGIKKDQLLFGSSLLDITPTLLTLFGLPIGEDMDGKVLLQAFEEAPKIKTIKSWEEVAGEAGQHKTEVTLTQEEMEAELQQLIDLGYIQDPGENKDIAIKTTVDENNFYLARAYINGGEWEEGIRLLEQLHKENPKTWRYGVRLAYSYQSVGKYRDAREIVDFIRASYDRSSPQLDILEGTLLMAEGRYKKSLALFQKAEEEVEGIPNMHLRIANAYLQLNKLEEAEAAIKKELALDSEEAGAWFTLGVTYYRMGNYEDALEVFLKTIGLLYHFPQAHFYVGECLIALEKYEEATEAFETCLRLASGFNAARKRLVRLYQQFLNQPGKAFKYQSEFESLIKGEITIVSGLPRSGTSMMMQMLEAGGSEIFSDKERTSDESNPKGYYEHEAVKNIAQNKKWIVQANGKVVKVIAQLLKHLPMNYRYKVIFMERDVLEVVQSQQKMLSRNGKNVKTDTLPMNLVNSFSKTLEEVKTWAEKQPNVTIKYVSHREVIENPFMQAMLVNDFLGWELRPELMAAQVDGNLYREKITKTAESAI